MSPFTYTEKLIITLMCDDKARIVALNEKLIKMANSFYHKKKEKHVAATVVNVRTMEEKKDD